VLDRLVWPWAEQRKAERQLGALHVWAHGEHLTHLWLVACGYARAHDWIGVEACYTKARAHLEGE
jgi:hypothetical protein